MADEIKEQKPSLFGMIWSPTIQLERIKERPTIWGALAIISILFMIGSWFTLNGADLPFELEGLSKDESLVIEKVSNVFIVFFSIFLPAFTIVISSFIYWIVAKIIKSEVSFRQLFSMHTHIMVISALGLIINGIIYLMIGGSSEEMYTGLSSIVHTKGPIEGLINSMELFSIWGIVLTAIGLQKVADFSKGLAWSIVIAFFVIGILFSMLSAYLNNVIGSF